jgi:hypothetical protein
VNSPENKVLQKVTLIVIDLHVKVLADSVKEEVTVLHLLRKYHNRTGRSLALTNISLLAHYLVPSKLDELCDDHHSRLFSSYEDDLMQCHGGGIQA